MINKIKQKTCMFIYLRQLKKQRNAFNINLSSSLDRSTIIGDYIKINGKSTIFNSTIGDFFYCVNAHISLSSIGKFCSVGPNVIIGGLGTHPLNFISTHPVFYSTKKQCGITFAKFPKFNELNKTIIGNDVWIGANAVILDGVVVGDGAVIAAGAIVTKDVKPYSIVGGIPAKDIRFRHAPEIITALLELKWWNLPNEILFSLSDEFTDDNLTLQKIVNIKFKIKKLTLSQ